MKKKSLIVLFAASVLALSASACGADKQAPSGQEQSELSQIDEGAAGGAEETGSAGNETENSENTESADGSDTDVTNDISNESAGDHADVSPVSVTFEESSDEIKADDGTLLLENSASMPVVTIEGADEIAAKINADIETHYNLSSDEETLEMAKSDYETSQADENGGWFHGYAQSVTADVTRMDDKVLSLELTFYSYTGGAHGNYGIIGKNYDLRTGELIGLKDLSDDYDAFHATALDYVVNQAHTSAYQGLLYDFDKSSLDNALFSPDWEKWVFTESGVSFFADPYAIGPYASGEIYFTLPYERAYQIGLKEDYHYTGNFVDARYYITKSDPETMEPVVDGTPDFYFDLNGDGVEEGLAFYGLVSSGGGESSPYAFYIDENDWGKVVNEQLGDLVGQGFLDSTYALYDVDPSDGLTEIAVLFTEFSEDAGAASGNKEYTYLFRYTKDKELQFLERRDGFVTRPALP